MNAKKYLILGIAMLAVLTALSTTASAGGYGEGCPWNNWYNGTLNGGVYFVSHGDYGGPYTGIFENVPANRKIVRFYPGIWLGSPWLGRNIKWSITFDNGHTENFSFIEPDIPFCNATVPPEDGTGESCTFSCTGCGVCIVTYNASEYIVTGNNTISFWTNEQIYDFPLLVVYENESMPPIQYGIKEGHEYPDDTFITHFNETANTGKIQLGSLQSADYYIKGNPRPPDLNPSLNGNLINSYRTVDKAFFVAFTDIPPEYVSAPNNTIVSGIDNARAMVAVFVLQYYDPSDLSVTNISPQSLYANYINEINATVTNYAGYARLFNVTLYANDTKIDVKKVTNLSQGESKTVTFEWEPDHEGAYELNVTADVENVVLETNEVNNTKIKEVNIEPAPVPEWRNQSCNVTEITSGEAIELRAQGKAKFGLDYAVLWTDETGSWKECNDYGSPMQMSSNVSDSFTHTTDSDWDNQTRYNLSVNGGDVKLARFSGTVNIAQDKPAYASSSGATKPPGNAVDGDKGTLWISDMSQSVPQWWYVDLGEIVNVNKISIYLYDAFGPYDYAIDISNDAADWTTMIENQSKTETFTDLGWSCQYLRVYFYGAQTGDAYMGEFEAYEGLDYKPTGTMTSTTTTTENPIISVTPTWNAAVPTNASLSVNVSVDNSATWKTATNSEEITWDYDVSNTNLKYKVEFETTDNATTPVLHDITLNYTTKNEPKDTWVWSNFTWHNPAVSGKTVGWKIYYEDILGQTNCTDVKTFDVIGSETVAPFTDEHSPAKNATDVPIDTNISVHVKDYGTGVNKSTIKMTVSGTDVTSELIISGAAADYTVVYEPLVNFGYDQVVNVTVDAADLNETPNVMETDAYHFTTRAQDTLPPYTEGHDPAKDAINVPVDTNITVHVKDDGVGVNKSTIVMTVNGIDVTSDLIISGSASDYKVVYDPQTDFSYGEVVNVTVNASDLELPPNNITDEYSFTIVGDKPDLIIKSIDAYHYNTAAQPYSNLSNEVDVVVENVGTAAANPSNVSLYIGDNLTGRKNVPAIGAGNSTTVQFKWTPVGEDCEDGGSPVNYTLEAIADCDNAIDEQNETNNASTKVETAYWAGYYADELLETVHQGTVRGGLNFTTGDGTYTTLYNPGDTATISYDITLPSGATTEFARLNVYYTWSKYDYPFMEVNITNKTKTYTVPLNKSYNDRPCDSPPVSFNYLYGNYVYDLTPYIKGNGIYTVAVKNAGNESNPSDFCIAAPGLVILYEDNSKPKYDYWIIEGADLLEGGRRGGAGYLALEECINNATFEGTVDKDNATTATLGVVSQYGESTADKNYLYFNGNVIGTGVYHGYSSQYSKTQNGMSMHIGGTNSQMGVNITDVKDYLAASDNVVGQGDNGDSMMPANAFLLVEYPVDYGVSAVIDEKYRKVKPGDNVTYTVRVKNTGTFNASYEVTISGTAVEEPTINVNPLSWNTGNLTSGSEHITIVNISTADDTPEQAYTLTATATCDQDLNVTDSDTAKLEVVLPIPADFVVGDQAGEVELFMESNGSFSSIGIITDVGDLAWGLAGGDFNGDGYTDFIVGDYAGQVELFLGHGFSSAEIITGIGGEAYGLTSGDYDNNGSVDFIVGNGAGELKLFLNNGSAFNPAGVIEDIGDHAWGLTSCDFNGDDNCDFVSGDYEGTLKLFTNDGNGNFASSTIADIGNETYGETYGVTSGDYDSDGDCDFLATANDGEVKLFKNNGAGSFTNCGTVISLGTWRYGLESNDFDADGDIDVLGETSDDTINLYKNNGTGNFSFDRVVASPGQKPRGLTSGYFVMPDLTVTQIDTPIVYANVSNVITATIENAGNENAGAFNTTLYADEVEIETKQVSTLNADASTTVSFSWTPAHTGSYELQVMADSAGAIEEFNESNNDRTKAVTAEEAVLPPTPNIIKYGYVFYENGTECNGPVVNVKNLDSGNEWSAETYNTSHHYELILDSNDKNVSDVLRFTATDKDPDATQEKVTEYTVTQAELDDGGIFGLNLTLQPVGAKVVDNVTTADKPVSGTVVTGSYVDTNASDNVYETIEEIESKGKPANRYSYLEHKWTIDVISGNKTQITFHLEANRTNNTEGDDFKFEYSTDENTGYEYMVTVNTSTDTNLSCELLSNLSGTVYIRVTNTDQKAGNRSLDTISIDHMFIRSVLGISESDTTPPAAAEDLAASDPTSSSIKLTWTAPGDDGNTGNATSYDIRYSTATITESNWDSATRCTDEPSPQPAGSSETFTVTGLDANTTYYFALKTSDEVPNESPLSNVTSNTTSEASPNMMHIASIDMSRSTRTAGKNVFTHATALVTIVNIANGALIEGATVHGYWSIATDDIDSGTTNSLGQVSLDSNEVKNAQSGTNFTFTVDGVTNGLAWDGIEKSNSTIV